MNNEQRERLIEILDNGPKDLRYEDLPGYLLKNGVVVLPCKVGDKVYVLHNTYERIELGLSDCIYETVVDSIHISGITEYHMRYKKITHPDCDFFLIRISAKLCSSTKRKPKKHLKEVR